MHVETTVRYVSARTGRKFTTLERCLADEDLLPGDIEGLKETIEVWKDRPEVSKSYRIQMGWESVASTVAGYTSQLATKEAQLAEVQAQRGRDQVAPKAST